MPWVESSSSIPPNAVTFTGGVQNSLAPWADQQGNWQAINAALASMFEPVSQLLLDQGTPDCPLIGLLSQPVGTSLPIQSIPVSALLQPIAANTLVMLVAAGGSPWQLFTANTAGAQGATAIGVYSQTPNFAFPAGSFVCLGYAAGWSTLLDPDACPTQFLPFLGQCTGVSVPPNTPDAQARAIIKAESGFQRGTPAAIITAVQSNLTGTQSVKLIERSPNAYGFVVAVKPQEIATSVAAITASIQAVKPAGLTFQVVVTNGTIWAAETNTWASDTQTWAQKG